MKLVYRYWVVPGMRDVNCTPAFMCDLDECGLYYDIIRGYHKRPGDKIRRIKQEQLCPRDGLPMFVMHREPHRNLVGYQCSQVGCDGRREVRARDRKSTRLNSSHIQKSRMPSSA